jgi:hypothetical protein
LAIIYNKVLTTENCDRYSTIDNTNSIVPSTNKKKIPKTRVLSTKISLEDYQAYKIAADELFDESMSKMVKTALRRELRANGVDDKKFEILKDAAKTGDLSEVNDAFFVLKPKLVKFTEPRQYRIGFE